MLQNLLNATVIRSVGKPYIQDALTNHATHFKRNYEVLSLRRYVSRVILEMAVLTILPVCGLI